MREAFDVAVGLLARREHSVRQLTYKLAKRGFDEPAIASALETCQRLNLQSDTRFAGGTCRSRIARGYGPLMIKQLLAHEGVSSDIIEQIFDEINQDIDWVAEASSVWMKKFRASSVSDDALDKARQKQWQFLRYRGFADATVRAMFEALEAESNN
jgi:regulatory protein